MKDAVFQSRFESLSDVIGPKVSHFRDSDFWETAGSTSLDEQLTQLADLYAEASAPQRALIRTAVNPRAEANLVMYVRRLSILILREKDPSWLRRGLDIACIENGRFDYRDSIVSIVILRSAAERSGIDPVPYFDEAIRNCDKGFVDVIENARDHRPKDVRDLLRAFGPPALKPKRQNQNKR